jgi:hypothetical protein
VDLAPRPLVTEPTEPSPTPEGSGEALAPIATPPAEQFAAPRPGYRPRWELEAAAELSGLSVARIGYLLYLLDSGRIRPSGDVAA